MSDGNFNRALLPKNELSAGIRAGKAQMRTKAEKAFKEVIMESFPDIQAEDLEEMQKCFMEKLRK
ncbi:MAG: hypothetical protein IJ163_10745 [Bacteroidaceae bacterium]|jgi:hypothetical protein|nr:hypothetical protein [Bacteroidaceae bacterium]MBQ9165236.1 hypothetical protein [Bacteroidaceae bacterium]